MMSLAKYLDCGNIYTKSSSAVVDYKVKKFADIAEKIIPFFPCFFFCLPLRDLAASRKKKKERTSFTRN
jgi:hypothetical protein